MLLTILLTAAECNKPPKSPSNVTIEVQDSQAVISWNSVAGATSYNIYLASQADVSKTNYQSKTDGQKVTDASSPHTVSGLTNGTTYYFVVTALNANGESAESNEESATPTASTSPPDAPSNVAATAKDSAVEITWDAAIGAATYNIYLASEADVNKTNYQSKTDGQKVTDASSPHTVSGLTNGTTYYFVVTALNANGESAESDEKSATPTASTSPPDAPSNVAATAKDGAVEITWDASSEATSYNLYFSSEAGVTKDNYQSKTDGQKVESVTSPHTQSGLTNGTIYYFVVTALNANGESAESDEKSATPTASTSPPDAPSNVAAIAKDGAVEITWDTNLDTAAEATSYNLYWASEAGITKDNYQSKADGQKVEQVTSPHTQSGLTNGTTYYFIVTALNANGESTESDEKSATPTVSTSPPDAPSNVAATAKDGAVEITWDADAGATSYNLYLASEAGITKDNYQSKTDGQKVEQVTSPYTQSGLTNGTTYYFVVTGVNPAGESTESAEASATPAAQGQQFNPTEDTNLPAGDYDFDSINIPEGVKVTLEGEVTFNVTGDISIAGSLESDCDTLSLLGEGDIAITGEINTECNDPDKSGDIIIETTGGVNIGTSDAEAKVEGSGEVIIRDPTLEEWMFDVPFEADTQLAAQQGGTIAPVCSASSDVVTGSASADFPIEVSFSGKGVDPDRGPVTYSWDFDDGGSSTEQNPVHTFNAAGVYDVKLTTTDDENETCMAALRLVFEDDTTTPEEPAVWIEPDTSPLPPLVAIVGQAVDFPSLVEDLQNANGDLTYSWDFGDGSPKSSEVSPSHSYTAVGRYEISLIISDPDNNSSVATASVYIVNLGTPPPPLGLCPPPPVPPGYNFFNAAVAGRNRVVLLRPGNYMFGPRARLTGLDGNAGAAGENGKNGTSITVLITGKLIICGSTFITGHGGDGGDETKTSTAPATARARGGHGGKSGNLRITAGGGVEFGLPPRTTIDIGDGGNGGDAKATGGDGKDDCTSAQKGGGADARGGNGGKSAKFVTAFNVVGLAFVDVQGGLGGDGGDATATAGKGGVADCLQTATGGDGGTAKATGGDGGRATLAGVRGFIIDVGAFTGGDGGDSTADGGNGGDAIADPDPDQPCQSTKATGGNGGRANTKAGRRGIGRINGVDGVTIAQAGRGGDAEATGGDCDADDGADGGSAEATGGEGGNATARRGLEPTADAGNGGNATATGGKGANCIDCPKIDGGNGGNATATGGKGGNALGDGVNTDGDGGDATANGGMGGDGDDGCAPAPIRRGGNGGKGGDATANAGTSKGSGGTGTSGGAAGDGGNGNNGNPPGGGGAAGTPRGNPTKPNDGNMGVGGNPCPLPVAFKLSIDIDGNPEDVEVTLDPPMPPGGYLPGTTVKLTAKVKVGSDFVFCEWSGDASDSNPEFMLTMDGDKSVGAKFVKSYELKVETEGDGEVTFDPQPNAPNTNNRYKENTSIDLLATPAEGNEFKRWEGDCAGANSEGNKCTLTMDGDKMVRAVFGPRPQQAFKLSIDNSGSGTGSVNIAPPMPASGYAIGTVVTLTAVPDLDSAFDVWSGDASGSNPVVMITMDSDKSVVAKFVRTYDLQIEIEGEGEVVVNPTPNASDNRYKEGTAVTLAANPAQGNEFKEWQEDCIGSAGNTCSLTMDGDKMVRAVFGPPLDACQSLFGNLNLETIGLNIVPPILREQLTLSDSPGHLQFIYNFPSPPSDNEIKDAIIEDFEEMEITLNKNGMVSMTAPDPVIDVTGEFFPINGSCNITATGMGSAAGFDNVEAQLIASLDPITSNMDFQYFWGINGAFPGNLPAGLIVVDPVAFETVP